LIYNIIQEILLFFYAIFGIERQLYLAYDGCLAIDSDGLIKIKFDKMLTGVFRSLWLRKRSSGFLLFTDQTSQ
jgi:hypothetical protein